MPKSTSCSSSNDCNHVPHLTGFSGAITGQPTILSRGARRPDMSQVPEELREGKTAGAAEELEHESKKEQLTPRAWVLSRRQHKAGRWLGPVR
jgi:hypothetical protein